MFGTPLSLSLFGLGIAFIDQTYANKAGRIFFSLFLVSFFFFLNFLSSHELIFLGFFFACNLQSTADENRSMLHFSTNDFSHRSQTLTSSLVVTRCPDALSLYLLHCRTLNRFSKFYYFIML